MALGVTAAPAGAAHPSRTSLPGSVPRWAQPSRDRGAAAGSKQVTVTVYLPLRDAAAANALAQQVSDPASAGYGQFLTPDAIRRRFGANDADVAAVSSFLRGAGLNVTDVPTNNHHVEATGTLAQAEAAFDTSVHRYAYRGRVLEAPSTALSVPSSLDGKVLAVTGLDQSGVLNTPQNDLAGATSAGYPGACSPAPVAALRRLTRSSTRRRARRTSVRRPRSSTRRSTARRPRSRRAATRHRSTRAPTAPRACSTRASTGAA